MPPHVQAAIDSAQAQGVAVHIGPSSNTMQGNAQDVLHALHAAQSAAVAAGATRIVVNIEAEERVAGNDEFARALADALGPLHRISVLDTAGNVEASYGTVTSKQISRVQLPLAGSPGTLLV
jgi:uncharacterized protein YqgV (UPF0045/DUF77 family)